MMQFTAEQNEIKQVIDNLIQTATTYDVEALENIYHDELEVIMVDDEYNVNKADKAGFKALFDAKRKAGDPPMDTWAKFHHISRNEQCAYVVLSRRNNLNGFEMMLFLDIELIFEDNRWQIKREAIFLHPKSA